MALEANHSGANLLRNPSSFITRGCDWLRRTMRRAKAQASARRFMAFCRKKWPWDASVKYDSVVLLGLFPPKISTYCHAHLANHLARSTGAGIEAFKITTGASALVQEIYASFGARVGLDASFVGDALPSLEKEADALLAKVHTKWELLEMHYQGLKIGDLVYDSYLRYHVEPTVNLEDPRLREIVVKSLIVFVATINYMKVKKIVGFIADDFSYHECGIITRIMFREKVPVYHVHYGPQYFVYRLDGERDYRVQQPFPNYREIFRNLPEEQQIRFRQKGRAHLEKRLAGHVDRLTNMTVSPFGEFEGKLFADTGRPRIVVLMHDFFDSPHGFRWMLFPDFYDWACFLFERASETPFDWYVKPHPGSWDPSRKTLNENNHLTFQRLQERFPKVTFIPATASNRQIVDEGVDAMFTMYGTAGHEFAWMGVPVVNAGDNRHINYDFNYHPRSVEEYCDLIKRADRLKLPINQDEIAEYVYMNYFYDDDHFSTDANPLPPAFYGDGDFEARTAGPTGYDQLIFPEDPEREAEMKRYYDAFLSGQARAVAAV